MSNTYEDDFYTWAMTQAEAARRRSGNEIDWDNVAEELESLGKSEFRELRSRYVVLLTHLLKWLFQPEARSKSWNATISVQRDLIAEHLEENPGLKARDGEAFAKAYRQARKEASGETELDLDAFPQDPPFTQEQAKDENWLP